MIKEKIIQEKDSKHEHSETLPSNYSLPLCINQLTPIRLYMSFITKSYFITQTGKLCK